MAASWRSDVTWFVKEMVSTLVTLEPLTRSPRVFDVDDAIWLSRGGRFARKLAQLVDLVIAGNGFLAEWFSSYNRHIVVVPTAVDTDKFCPPAENWEGERTRIGWIGTSGNLVELYRIEDALREVLVARPRSVLRVISDRPPAFSALPSERVEFVAWSRGGEVAALQEIDIGIMPLADTDWSRGKCAFKLLQYMACGRPVVASPVGVNAEILCAAGGTAAGTLQEWRDALIGLIHDREFRAEVGRRGRKLVEAEYSVKAIAPKLARCFQMLVSNKG